jgi:hypothetical protein|tara:strand:+ start:325 stop:522 length:198 start_codon:yes stop_codon:yes gene_type:complete
LITKHKEIVAETAQSTKRDEKYIKIVVKHFFRGVKALIKRKLAFKETGMFLVHMRKAKKNRVNVK